MRSHVVLPLVATMWLHYGRAQPRLRVASFLTAAIGRRCWCVGTSKEAPRAPDARSVSASSPDPVAGWMQGLERRRAIEKQTLTNTPHTYAPHSSSSGGTQA